mmetsp:Transcript_34782/g.59631  ORF Transcript_34782/g.59631 Transcript_34782/m.59631 type:complete len:320 (+) Transcript_34782:367-1326(+)
MHQFEVVGGGRERLGGRALKPLDGGVVAAQRVLRAQHPALELPLEEDDALGQVRLRLDDLAHHRADHLVGDEPFRLERLPRQRRRVLGLEPALDGRPLEGVAVAREDGIQEELHGDGAEQGGHHRGRLGLLHRRLELRARERCVRLARRLPRRRRRRGADAFGDGERADHLGEIYIGAASPLLPALLAAARPLVLLDRVARRRGLRRRGAHQDGDGVARLEQTLDFLAVPGGRVLEGGLARGVADASPNVGGLEQQPRDLDLARDGGDDQGRHAELVGQVDVRPALEKHVDDGAALARLIVDAARLVGVRVEEGRAARL